MASILSPISFGGGRVTSKLGAFTQAEHQRNLERIEAQRMSRAARSTSNIGAFQAQTPQSIQQSLKSQLQGIQGARGALQGGFNQSSSLLRQNTQKAVQGLRDATTAGLASLQGGLEQVSQTLAPIKNTTIGALERFSALTGISGDSQSAINALRADPGYQFRLEEGLKAAQRGHSAQGIGGGRAMIELQERGEGLAAQELGSAVNRLTNIIGLGIPVFQQEAGIQSDFAKTAAGLQTSTASQTASLLASQGSQLAGLRTQLASDLADASLASAGARSQAALAQGSVLKILQQALGQKGVTTNNVSLGG